MRSFAAASDIEWVYVGQLVQLLVEAGADTELCDREGKKPIDVVCQAGYRPYNKPVIEALLQVREETQRSPPFGLGGAEGGHQGSVLQGDPRPRSTSRQCVARAHRLKVRDCGCGSAGLCPRCLCRRRPSRPRRPAPW